MAVLKQQFTVRDKKSVQYFLRLSGQAFDKMAHGLHASVHMIMSNHSLKSALYSRQGTRKTNRMSRSRASVVPIRTRRPSYDVAEMRCGSLADSDAVSDPIRFIRRFRYGLKPTQARIDAIRAAGAKQMINE
jgi:hypothetical protein